MSDTHPKSSELSRRDFLRAATAAGVGSLLTASHLLAADSPQDAPSAMPATQPTQPAEAQMPRRSFGKTGETVSILGLGGMFDINTNQRMLQLAIQYGVTYWDTADCYNGGKSEQGIGMYFEKHPEDRKKIFLVTKSDARDPKGMSDLLNRSLERMKTDVVDLYFIHGLKNAKELEENSRAWKAWSEQAKKSGKIRFFGFSTHKNMPECMDAAAKAGFIDGIMPSYNLHVMNTDKMKAAVEACTKAGIGLTAMKTQGRGPVENEAELKLAGQFLSRGFTPQQANLKVVWENPQIACICSQMPNTTILMANIAAALDKTALSLSDREVIRQYAAAGCEGYCGGCASLCEGVAGNLPISDVMRFLMYHNSYGETLMARQQYQSLSRSVRAALASADFSTAEKNCPRGLPIASLMRRAAEILA